MFETKTAYTSARPKATLVGKIPTGVFADRLVI
jgi:hypothetical protein